MSAVKRVLHLPNNLSKKSGIMSVIMNYYRNIDREKVQFDFLCFKVKNSTYEEEILKLGGQIFYIDQTRNIFKLKKQLDIFFKMHHTEYDIIHYHAISIWNIALNIASNYNINNLIAHSHATVYGENVLSKIKNYLTCITLKKQANIYFACSRAAGEFLYGFQLVQEGKVYILNNAVNINKFKYNNNIRDVYREKMKLDNKYVIGHVGRFNEQKNHEFLIDIFYRLKKESPNSMLILVGEGPLKHKIQTKVKNLGLENDVMFLGLRDDVCELLQAMDVFVLPSFFEGLPVSAVEAQAAGLPCVLSERITREVDITDVDFLSIGPKECQKWVKALSKYVRHARSNTTLKLREQSFDIIQEVKKLEEYYLKL